MGECLQRPNTINSNQNLQLLLKSIYFENKSKFYEWLINKKLSKNYIIDINNVLDSTLKLKFVDVLDLRDRLTKVKNRKYRALALRNLFNFFEDYELLDFNLILKLKLKIKVTEKSNIDSFIPSDSQIEDFLIKIKHYDEIAYIFVKILLESGLRISEVQYFVKNLNKNNFETVGEVVVYPFYYLRGNKTSYYIFITKKLHLQILNNLFKLKKFNVEKLKTWIKRHKYISLKYTRKYNFTKLIKSGISFEIANFIQGRVSQNIGFNHYLAKKEIAIKEYQKIITKT